MTNNDAISMDFWWNTPTIDLQAALDAGLTRLTALTLTLYLFFEREERDPGVRVGVGGLGLRVFLNERLSFRPGQYAVRVHE